MPTVYRYVRRSGQDSNLRPLGWLQVRRQFKCLSIIFGWTLKNTQSSVGCPKLLMCRVARTHSLCLKLIKIHPASPLFRSFPYLSTFGYQSKSQSKFHPTLQYQIQQKLTQTPCKHSAHICLFSTIHCIHSYYQMLPHFPHSFWPLVFLCDVLSRESPLQPGFNEGSLDRVRINFAKVENPNFRFSPPCWT